MKTRFALALMTFCVALAPATVRSQSQESLPQESLSQESRSQDSPSQYSESATDKAACMADAFMVCRQFIPDREQVGNCLVANSSEISSTCREALKRFVPQTATR